MIQRFRPETKFNTLSSKNGLSGDIVYALHKDKQGFCGFRTFQILNVR